VQEHDEHAGSGGRGPEFENVDVRIGVRTLTDEENAKTLVDGVGDRQPEGVSLVHFAQATLSVQVRLVPQQLLGGVLIVHT
jgi:hypothetical protein